MHSVGLMTSTKIFLYMLYVLKYITRASCLFMELYETKKGLLFIKFDQKLRHFVNKLV